MTRLIATLTLFVVFGSIAFADHKSTKDSKTPKWRALHLLSYNTDAHLEELATQIPGLAKMGINVLILEINYNFEFKSHPELRQGTEQITKSGARKFAEVCKRNGVRLIPEFQSLGHQSWKGETFPLLKVYPQLDITPGAFPNNEGIYCREWDPLNPEVNKIVFKLIDEIIDAFRADAIHVGMDEVFLLGSDQSPTTRGRDPAKLFAKVVNELYQHVVKKRHVEMLMWGDRLFDANKYSWSEWEGSRNGTAGAADMIPKDIIICPWHYELKDEYPSIPLLLEKGFRVLPASWKDVAASRALIEYSFRQHSPRLLGHLFTTWDGRKSDLAEYQPIVEGLKLLQEAGK
jgi:hypothetical protein